MAVGPIEVYLNLRARESERKLKKDAKGVDFINSTLLHMVLGLLTQGG
jgi:hypothetical protein